MKKKITDQIKVISGEKELDFSVIIPKFKDAAKSPIINVFSPGRRH